MKMFELTLVRKFEMKLFEIHNFVYQWLNNDDQKFTMISMSKIHNHRYQRDKLVLWNWATDKYNNIKMCVPQIKKLSEQASTTDV